ncbi:ribonuclease P protein component [Ilumatobacter coccineus]|uniref:ribonuclease P protein component n=1 Tax=Ilumatobacter coccineus TaxID=467094 RepID=UPI00068595C1|nr:ribonuclease P protein component [Ilumatobacter coccineus]
MIDRIRTRESFERLRREGRRVRVGPIWCTYVHDPSVTTPRVAFAISRAVGNAVVRNRLRRRLRAILADSDVPNGLLLIGVRPPVVELSFDRLRTTLEKLLTQL